MSGLQRTPVFRALTQPQMFGGVTYNFFIINAVITAELFLISKSLWALGAALVLHAIGYICCLREPRFFDLWIARASKCTRIKNFAYWRCNSYAP
jgi:type IV secretion system protein VirB3